MYKLDRRELVPHLVGVRRNTVPLGPPEDTDPFSAYDSLTNMWDDWLGLVYFDGTLWHEHMFRATTDPGNIATYPARGTAVMKPGQYVDAYKLGIHRKGTDYAHDAIINWGLTAPSYWRVARKGGQLEVVGEGDEYIGLNIHRARSGNHAPPATVGPYSAGCQVMANIEDWTWFLAKVTTLASHADHAYSLDYMTYTLLMLSDVTEAPPAQGHQLRGDGTISLIPEEEE
jgi:hypothetical protein